MGSTEDLKKIINTSYPPESKIKRTYEAILKMISVRFEPTDETDRDQKGEDYYGSRCWERMEAEIVEEKEKLQQRIRRKIIRYIEIFGVKQTIGITPKEV